MLYIVAMMHFDAIINIDCTIEIANSLIKCYIVDTSDCKKVLNIVVDFM